MKSYRRWTTIAMLLALAATGAVVTAQDKQPNTAVKTKQKAEFDRVMRIGGAEVLPDGDRMWFGDEGTMMFVASEMMTGDHVVKGAPYSAQAVTESIQTLADGNRIVHKTTTSIYRDGEGRTRNDQAVGNAGPYATMGEPSQVIMINDPVGGAHYMLDPRTKLARKIPFPKTMLLPADGKASDDVTTDVQVAAGAAAMDKQMAEMKAMKATVAISGPVVGGQVAGVPAPKGLAIATSDMATFNVKLQEPKMEQLGKQTIEGVEVEGQRATITIPAGEIGNEQPILIVSETWYSSELQVTVLSRHSDPRMGETVYKLTGINRAEPSHALFEVPADYTVKEAVEPKMKMLLDRELKRSRKPADKQ